MEIFNGRRSKVFALACKWMKHFACSLQLGKRVKVSNGGRCIYSILFFIFIFAGSALGWDYSKHNIPIEEIRSGGPPKDGIPALTDPKFITVQQAEFLSPRERVLGIYLDGKAKAYPLKILNWHEIVNDMVGNKPVVVTYCPLTGSGIAYDARINNYRIEFGVSGKLYKRNLLLYDRSTESLWSQLKMEAVTGEMTGTKLRQLLLYNTTWSQWKRLHPDTKVLSRETGYMRNYSWNPYLSYQRDRDIYSFLSKSAKTLPSKALVLGVILKGKAKAYPFSVLSRTASPLLDNLAGEELAVFFDNKDNSAWIKNRQGEFIPSVETYWFAWRAFYPDTEVFAPGREN